MSPATHFLTGWVFASIAPLNRRERAAVTIAAVVPDVDGVGIGLELLTRNSAHPLLWFSQYHHALHNVWFALIVAMVSFAVATRRWLTATLALIAFHLHLLEDLVGSRGPDGFSWPIPYLAPVSTRWNWAWHGQWALNAWPNFVVTGALLAVTLYFSYRQSRTPVELFSTSADKRVVATLRNRFS